VGKTSLHVRLDVQVASMIEHRFLARHLIVSWSRALWTFLPHDRRQSDCHTPAVYTSFRSRMLACP
jgi:hypothetical protein